MQADTGGLLVGAHPRICSKMFPSVSAHSISNCKNTCSRFEITQTYPIRVRDSSAHLSSDHQHRWQFISSNSPPARPMTIHFPPRHEKYLPDEGVLLKGLGGGDDVVGTALGEGARPHVHSGHVRRPEGVARHPEGLHPAPNGVLARAARGHHPLNRPQRRHLRGGLAGERKDCKQASRSSCPVHWITTKAEKQFHPSTTLSKTVPPGIIS